MIERQFIAQKLKQFMVQEFITNASKRSGHSKTVIQRTPLGEKITIYAANPGMVVGRKGQNIRLLTTDLKKKFKFDNPQIETIEVEDKFMDASIVAGSISSSLERFGSQRFKAIGHRMMSDVLQAGAKGVEIIISGKIPGARAKSWRFYQGYLKKCGEFAISGVKTAHSTAQLKSGTIGIKVKIMPADIKLPDYVEVLDEPVSVVEEIVEPKKTTKTTSKKEKKKSKPKKKAPAKKSSKTVAKKEENKK